MRPGMAARIALAASIALVASLTALHCGDAGAPGASGTAPPPRGDGSVMPAGDAGAADVSTPVSPPGDGAPGHPPDGSPPDAPLPEAATPAGRVVAYASGYAPSIDVFTVDPGTGALTLDQGATVASFGQSPSFLAVNPSKTNLYAVDEETQGQIGAYSINPKTGGLTFLNAASSGGNGPPFVLVDATGKYVLVANYGDGTVSVLPVLAGGKIGAPRSTLQVGAEAHMIVPDPSNRFVFVPCKGADYVAQFVFDVTTGSLTPNATAHFATAKGAGPRHLAWHPGGTFAYLINENASTMTALAFDGTKGTLSEIETQSTLPAGFTGTNTGAEVWVHPSGRWVIGSNRGDDSLVVFAVDLATGKLTPKGFTKSGGKTPRDFTFDPTGTFLFAANQDSGNVVPFRFDEAAGSLTPTAGPVTVSAASFVGVITLAAP